MPVLVLGQAQFLCFLENGTILFRQLLELATSAYPFFRTS